MIDHGQSIGMDYIRINGAPRQADIFSFKLEKETSVDDVKEYVTGKGVTVHEIECLSHEESMYRSFRLSVCYSKLEDVLAEEFGLME